MLANPHLLLNFDKVHNPLRRPRETTSERPKVLRTRQFFALLTGKCASRHSRVHFFNISTSKSALNVVFFGTFWLGNVLRAKTACTFSTSQLPKVLWTWGVLYILTWKCASRHNRVHFFDTTTSKSAPSMRCFARFDLEMWWNVLRASSRHTGVHFSTSQLPKEVRRWCALYILTSKRASPHNGVQLFISHIWPHGSAPVALASLLFDPQIIRKTQCFATFLPFRAPASSFFSLFLFSDLLSSALLLSDSSHSAFPSVHIVGSLTSKLPSINHPPKVCAPSQRLPPPSPSCPPLRGCSLTSNAATRLRAERPLPEGQLWAVDLEIRGMRWRYLWSSMDIGGKWILYDLLYPMDDFSVFFLPRIPSSVHIKHPHGMVLKMP